MRTVIAATLAVLLTGGQAPAADTADNPMQPGGTWEELAYDVLGDAVPADGSGVFDVEAPYRAHDAATVPIIIRQLDPKVAISAATLVIDENPAPVAAELTFGKAMAPLELELRVRVNQYSNVRVIADTPDGPLMSGRYVKASGGCSAPATKDPEQALALMGAIKLKEFQTQPQMSVQRRESQIMIRHPNYSGLQRDQITQLFISAHFIDSLEVFQGDEMLFTMHGGISISENPVFRFKYDDNGAEFLRVRATDTDGNTFESLLSKAAS